MDLLSDILSHMRLAGTLYFRTSFTSPWSIKVPPFENVARFHFAHKGRCLVRIESDKPPVFLEQGDLLIIMGGVAHTLYCDPKTENQAIKLDQVVEQSGFTGKGALVFGELGTDHETQLVCGHFAFTNDVRHILIDALPSYIQIKNYGMTNGAWMENTLQVIGNEAGRDQLGSDIIALKMSEIIFAQALRTYLESDAANAPVLAGFAQPNIAKALTSIHQNPGHSWTLGKLAEIAGMSRTAFTTKFTNSITMTPMAYITHWRMQIAKQQLASSTQPIIEIAEKVGYHSEAAFGRVFKKHHLQAPATYRRSAQISQSAS